MPSFGEQGVLWQGWNLGSGVVGGRPLGEVIWGQVLQGLECQAQELRLITRTMEEGIVGRVVIHSFRLGEQEKEKEGPQ